MRLKSIQLLLIDLIFIIELLFTGFNHGKIMTILLLLQVIKSVPQI
jgi:hypothetical protein